MECKLTVIRKMKFLTMLMAALFLIVGCRFPGQGEKEAIQLVQTSKMQFGNDNLNALQALVLGYAAGNGPNSTWQDFANQNAAKSPETKFEWRAKEQNESDVYLVSFADETGWGTRWEANLKNKTVNYVNNNEYLSRKYGLTRVDHDGKFSLTKVVINKISIDSSYPNDIYYIIKASAVNNTDKPITSAEVTGKLQVIFKDKVITGEPTYDSGLDTAVSLKNSWQPGTEKTFSIKTKGIDKIYLSYKPEYVIFSVGISAQDPVGFSYNKDIEEYDLKSTWESMGQLASQK